MQARRAERDRDLDPVIDDQPHALGGQKVDQQQAEHREFVIRHGLVTQLHPARTAPRGGKRLLDDAMRCLGIGDEAKRRDHAGAILAPWSSSSGVRL